MPSHFSTIGLPVESQNEMIELARRVVSDCVSFNANGGRYLRWLSSSGAELWLQVDTENRLLGMTPHFSGKSRVRVGLVERVIRPDGTELDGAFYGWAEPTTDEPESGIYPFVFDVPDFQLHRRLSLPATVTVQVAAFTHEVSIFDSKEAFRVSQIGKLKYASQSFIPSGLFSSDGKSTKPPEAYAIFAGHILEVESRTNELRGRSFWWVLVETLGGVLDVVIDPGLLSTSPKVGGVLYGSFWLSGRIVSEREHE